MVSKKEYQKLEKKFLRLLGHLKDLKVNFSNDFNSCVSEGYANILREKLTNEIYGLKIGENYRTSMYVLGLSVIEIREYLDIEFKECRIKYDFRNIIHFYIEDIIENINKNINPI